MQRCFVTNHYLKSQSFINSFGSELISQISTGYFFFCRFRFLVTSETSGTHLFHVYLGVSVNARVSSWNLNHCFLYPYFTSPAVHPFTLVCFERQKQIRVDKKLTSAGVSVVCRLTKRKRQTDRHWDLPIIRGELALPNSLTLVWGCCCLVVGQFTTFPD